LRSDGLIKVSNHHITLLDIPQLELIGHFQPLNLTRILPAPNVDRGS
jgi:hypothetical protein